jgi:hypothetical protein
MVSVQYLSKKFIYLNVFNAAVAVQSKTLVGSKPKYSVPMTDIAKAIFKLPHMRKSKNPSVGSRIYI